ncbi:MULTISPECIES: MaoC family dehydratase [unclassified Aureimonas]|uniref:MaoC family dehydratase n=1 Tax=unclassified Aureimonas TaxID=2615206 RepID=UPI0006FDC0A7|nr:MULTISPECIES: MaoC family dehydratase [unclassified Aureimonas]KQT66127.1 enoyl-CoA hydratase [Aureimonas sp. Leaf427]KQT81009.1 enoyl-CoA hydratase [Aureimonas sp. Leaf460]
MQTFEDFPVGATRPLGPYEVTRDEVIAFAEEFDPQPFHLDEEAAAASMLGGLSASGWHTCAMMMRMMADSFVLDSTSQGSPGVDFVKWKRPVRPGDTLSGTMTVLEARISQKRPSLGITKLRNDVRNQAGEAVLECEYTVMLLTREGAAA